jgi:hypothetical protein
MLYYIVCTAINRISCDNMLPSPLLNPFRPPLSDDCPFPGQQHATAGLGGGQPPLAHLLDQARSKFGENVLGWVEVENLKLLHRCCT